MEPFSYAFMQRAGLGMLAVCVCAPVVGWWAVTGRLVYLTDAMSHAVLAGVAAAAAVGAGLLAGATAAALVMALLVPALTVRAHLPEDSAVGLVGQGLFAAGVLGISVQGDPRALSHLLFGNPLTVTWTDVAVQAALATVTVVGVTAVCGAGRRGPSVGTLDAAGDGTRRGRGAALRRGRTAARVPPRPAGRPGRGGARRGRGGVVRGGRGPGPRGGQQDRPPPRAGGMRPQPWRALSRGFFVLMTNVRPRRRTTCESGWFSSERSELRTFTAVLPTDEMRTMLALNDRVEPRGRGAGVSGRSGRRCRTPRPGARRC